MYMANWHKFSQNKDLADILSNTGQYRLVEYNENDTHWANGVNFYDHPRIKDSDKWPGKNKRGQILMAVRDALQKGEHY